MNKSIYQSKSKWEKSSQDKKNISQLQRDLNRVKETCNKFRKSNDDRKKQITDLSKFLDKLLKEERITKEEIGEFLKKRRNLKEEGSK